MWYMLTRVQVLIPHDIFQQARLAAVNRKLSFSKLVTRCLEKEVETKKKMSIYAALKKLAKINKRLKKKLPPDFATNDDYLYRLP